jgi:hypothetical protein
MSHANLGITEPGHGGFKVTLMQSGNILVQARSYGFMENVSISQPYSLLKLMVFCLSSGCWKERHLVRCSSNSSFSRAYAAGG